MLSILGGLIAARVFTLLLSKLFKKASAPNRILYSHFLFVIIATVIGGYGFADGGEPKFLQAFILYLIAALISLSYDLFRELKTKRESTSPSVLTSKN